MKRPAIAAGVVLALVVLAHYLATPLAMLADDPDFVVRWIEFSFSGFLAATALLLLSPAFSAVPGRVGVIGAFACWLGAFEEAQKGVCGLAGMGIDVPLQSGLCIETVGAFPYAVVAATFFVLTVSPTARSWVRSKAVRAREVTTRLLRHVRQD